MANNDEHTLLLGEIKGKLEMLTDSVCDLADGTQRMDTRLGKLETRAAQLVIHALMPSPLFVVRCAHAASHRGSPHRKSAARRR